MVTIIVHGFGPGREITFTLTDAQFARWRARAAQAGHTIEQSFNHILETALLEELTPASVDRSGGPH